jgi:hypothetical protein
VASLLIVESRMIVASGLVVASGLARVGLRSSPITVNAVYPYSYGAWSGSASHSNAGKPARHNKLTRHRVSV